ncbi:microtubule organization protein AKNA [Gastrophryne carolinensis]
MDSHNRQGQSDSSEDEEQNFGRYMDENGIIGFSEGGLEIEDTQVLGGDEDGQEQLLGMDRREMMKQDEDGFLLPESPSEDERSGTHNWKGQFSFSQATEERRNSHFIGPNNTDDFSSDLLSRSITLPSALEGRPPSRDQQLDMTEDEVEHGSSLGAWEGDEEENWNQKHTGFLYNENSAGEDQWEKRSGSPAEDYSQTSGNQEGEAITESILPSSPPVPSTWDTRLFDMLSITAGIADETFPESLHTDSADGSAAIPSGDPAEVSGVTKVSSQTRTLRTKPVPSPSTPPKMHSIQHSTVKRGKNANIAQYGRGQLNYPLPDFTKVGPRVRFPRDEDSYRPPQPRRQENQTKVAPALFKSPAEIVREVLLSSTEKPAQDPVIPPTVPQEFKTPQQATELVHQLQEDYHKLLTKYAEAENTIDRLRLGAKVHLYADPPKPSHSVQMGTAMQGSKVMEFTIPHAQMAAISSMMEDKVETGKDLGSSAALNDSVTPPDDSLPATPGSSSLQPHEDVHSTLRSHLETLLREVDLFEGLSHEGNLTPEEQRQAVQELRGSLDVLERRYLQAQEHYRQEQRRTGRVPQELDPQRELEEAIFQMGVHLDELQEQVDNSARPASSTDYRVTAHHLDNASVPLELVPIPATQTPYPQVTSPEPPRLNGINMGPSDREDPEEHLPQPLFHKHMQLEKDYGTLLSTYSSFKSLPDALGLEQDEWPQQLPQNVRPHTQPQDGSTQGQLQVSMSQDHTQATRSLDLKPPVNSQSHRGHMKSVGSQDHQFANKVKQHSPRPSHPIYAKPDTPQSISPTGSPKHDTNASSPSSRTSVPTTPSPTEHRRASSVYSRHSTAPGEERKSAPRRLSHGSKTFPHRVSVSSSLPQLKEQSPRTPTKDIFVSEESILGSRSRKNSISNKNSAPLGQNKSLTIKEGIAQRRILSPETDSGFLGSESGQSPLLHKQRHRLIQNREEPLATPSSSNSQMRRERQVSKNGTGKNASENISRAGKAFSDNIKPNNPWAGPEEGSSPSPGPKSLTESDCREESQTDESDLERERCNGVIGDSSSHASMLLSPTEEPPQLLGNFSESRAARDQAIHNLQNEVFQLRQHLESSLNQSPRRRKLGKPAAAQNQRDQQDERSPQVFQSLSSPVSRLRVPVDDFSTEHQRKSSLSHDQDRPHQSAQRGRVRGAYTDMTHGENSRRHRRRSRCQHWFISPPPPVNCAHSPCVPYSPVIYSTPPGVYVPVGYKVADPHFSLSAAPSPSPDTLHVEDLSYPLSRALEAAKELKVTSKQMCRSLTMDLSVQRSLRSSCLF